MRKKTAKRVSLINILSLLLAMIAPFLFAGKAEAVSFTNAYIRFDRMASNEVTTGMICTKTSSTLNTYRKLEITFPDESSATDFVVSATAANWQGGNLSTSNIDGNTAWPDIANATAGIVGNVVTWTHTADQTLNSANTYCFRWTNTAALTTPTTAGASDLVGTVRALNSSDGELMNSKYSTAIVGTDDDTITITATVPPTFSFALADNVDTFTSNLSPSSVVSTNGEVLTISTNAANGWTAWVKSDNQSLDSLVSGGTIPTVGTVNDAVDTLSAGTSGYVLDVNTGSGSPSIDDEYNGGANQGGTLSANFERIAYTSGPGASNTVTLVEKAAISVTQEAATDYTDTLTVVAAGMF